MVFQGLLLVAAMRAPAADPRIFTPLEVVDGAGTRLGSIISTAGVGPDAIGMVFEGRVWSLHVLPNEIAHSGLVHFESVDCSGQPYVEPDPDRSSYLVQEAKVVGSDWAVYTYDPDAAPFRRRVNSRIGSTSCVAVGADLDTVPATLQVRLATYLVPPFSVQPSAP